MDVCSFIKAVLAQDENTIRSFFHKDAYVNWHCSNEHFTVDEFSIPYPSIKEYPYMKNVTVLLYHYFAGISRNLSPLHTDFACKV